MLNFEFNLKFITQHLKLVGAQNKNRTCTPLRVHGPQPCASTISAIWANPKSNIDNR
jgi:hypothetical protein